MTYPAIQCQSLAFRYRDTNVLSQVSFQVAQGEFIGVIGPNGGGKSTLLKLILGFLKPSHGSIEVLGKDPELAQSEMAYVPQQMRYDRHFPISCVELVLSGRLTHLPWYGRFKRIDKEKAYEALEKVGLSHLAAHSFASLSGGQQQRILIARALVSDPKLLLLDEPTASVDSEAEKSILSLLQSMKGSLTLMMVTHDLQTAIHYVDRVLVVQHQVISYSPQEVCEHYALGLYHPPLLNLPTSSS